MKYANQTKAFQANVIFGRRKMPNGYTVSQSRYNSENVQMLYLEYFTFHSPVTPDVHPNVEETARTVNTAANIYADQ